MHRLPSNIPVVTISEDCNQSNASRSFTCAEGCTYSYSGSFNTPLTVEAGQMICITGSYAGPLVMNGGMLSVCGAINPSSISFNAGTIIVTGSATFNHLVMNDPNSGILVYGSLAINDGHIRGRIENFGSFSFQGQLELNAGGVFKNFGELTINEDVINNSIICNKGTLRITGKLLNSGAGSLYNYCKIYVDSDLKNNGTFENYGSISVAGNTDLITGNVIFGGGSKIITQNLQVNSDITGDGGKCSAIYINGTTRLNASATFSGKVDICDKDSIEVNSAKGNFTTNCACTIQPSGNCNIAVSQSDYERVTICHKPPGNPENSHTLQVGKSAVQAHLNHGDSMGECVNEGNGNANNGNGGNNDRQQQDTAPKDGGVFDNPNQNNGNQNNGNQNGAPDVTPPKIEIPKIELPKEVPKINLPEGGHPTQE